MRRESSLGEEEKQTEPERQRDRASETETDRQTDRQRERERARERERERERGREREGERAHNYTGASERWSERTPWFVFHRPGARDSAGGGVTLDSRRQVFSGLGNSNLVNKAQKMDPDEETCSGAVIQLFKTTVC